MSAKRTKISPRIRIREIDGLVSKRPASTNSGLAVGKVQPFSDNQTLVFSQSNNILYPVMLPSGSSLADVSGIAAKGRMMPGTSDVHFNMVTSSFAPFDETSRLYNPQHYTGSAGSGLDESFSGPFASRTAIRIDISPSSEKFIYRCPQRHIDNAPRPLEFSSEGTGFCYFNFSAKTWDDIGNVDPQTGASLKTDQAADVTPVTFYLTESLTVTSSVYYTGQFIPPSNLSTRGRGDVTLSTSEAIAMGITKTGTPTAAFFAPAASKYHAKNQYVLKMSDYISQPFLLEKVQVNLPIVARRTHSSSSYFQPLARSHVANDMHCREMDNYVVFLYRQARNVQLQGLQLAPLERDNSTDVTGSNRYLIASASMCFYNSPTFDDGLYCVGGGTQISGSFPFHTPAFKHDFKMSVKDGTTPPPFAQSHFSGSVSLEMIPEISSACLAGVSYLPSTMSNTETSTDIRDRRGWRLNYIQHAWPGTSGIRAMGTTDFSWTKDYSGKTTGNFPIGLAAAFKTFILSSSFTLTQITSSYTNLINVNEFYWQSSKLASASFDFDPIVWDSAGSCLETDPRFLKTPFGPSPASIDFEKTSFVVTSTVFTKRRPLFIGGASTFADESARQSPVVLLPTDEIVLGIDAGIAPFMRDCSSITGSFLKIESKQATLTLFGSQIVNGERRGNQRTLQTLGDAVHLNDVDTPVLDEFLLEKPITNVGSYYAPLATGSFVSGSIPTRGIQAYSGYPTLLPIPVSTDFTLKDWFKYPALVALTDDLSTPIDSNVFARYIFRADRFGQPANLLQGSVNIAANTRRKVLLPGSAIGGTPIASYPVTNIFTGSTTYSSNTSLHATSSKPYTES